MEMTRRRAIALTLRSRLALGYQNDVPAGSVVDCDLVKERIAQAVGIRIPPTRTLVGSQGCGPERVRAVATVHRQVEPVAEKKFRPFPPGTELPDPAQQVVSIDQRRRHIRCHRSEHQAGLDDAVQFTNGARHLLFCDMTQTCLEHEIEFSVLERHIDDRSELVELLQCLRRVSTYRTVVLDAPCIYSTSAQRT